MTVVKLRPELEAEKTKMICASVLQGVRCFMDALELGRRYNLLHLKPLQSVYASFGKIKPEDWKL